MRNTPNNIIVNAKKGRSNDFPYDDPLYRCRIVTEERKKINRHGEEVEILITRDTNPPELPQAVRQAMNQLPWQKRLSANPHHISPRKNPRILNNSKMYNRRGKQVRPKLLLRFNKNAITLIKNNERELLRNSDGTIKKSFLNRIVSKKETVIASKKRI